MLSLEQVFSEWLENHPGTINTKTTYERGLKQFCLSLDLDQLRQLSPKSVQAKIGDLNGSENSLRTYRTAIRAFLKDMGSKGLCDSALYQAVSVNPKSFSKQRPDTYIVFKKDLLINGEPELRNRVILLLTIAKCKISEILPLTWFDVDPDKQSIKVRYKKYERTIVLDDPLWSEFIQLRQGRSLDDYVFYGARGRKLSSGQVYGIIEAALARTGIDAEPGELYSATSTKKREFILL